jgi:hypothetical protein
VLVGCWSVKGGCGTSVVAAGIGVLLARQPATPEVLLADLGGDLPAVLGLASTLGPGIADWLAAGDEVGLDALRRLEREVPGHPTMRLLPRGSVEPAPARGIGDRLVLALTDGMPAGVEGARPVVVDCGRADESAAGFAIASAASVSLLVLRPCYVALRRAIECALRPTSVVLVDEPGRALGPADVEAALGVPVRAVIPWRADIARAVDAGLLTSRLPRPLAHALRRASS